LSAKPDKFIGGGVMTGREATNFFCLSAYNVERAAGDTPPGLKV
jgi:hypothetical protein